VSSGVSACGFALAGVFAGHVELARWLCLYPRRCRVRANGWPGSRTGRSPAGVAGAGGVLDAGTREPMIEACGERPPRSGSFVYAVVVTPRPVVRPGRPLAAFIPSLVPGAMCCRGHGAGSRQGRAGPIRQAPAPPGRARRAAGPGGGQNVRRPRARWRGAE
jgi:hypothetical protein